MRSKSAAASRVLLAAKGERYVKALRYDTATDAMLMERLGPRLESTHADPR
jgi:hypothetical protein